MTSVYRRCKTHAWRYIGIFKGLDDFYVVSGLKRNDKKTRKPFGLELIVGTMEYQLLQEISNCLNTKLKLQVSGSQTFQVAGNTADFPNSKNYSPKESIVYSTFSFLAQLFWALFQKCLLNPVWRSTPVEKGNWSVVNTGWKGWNLEKCLRWSFDTSQICLWNLLWRFHD